MNDGPGSSTAGRTGKELDLTTAYSIEIGEEAVRGAVTEDRGEALQAVVSVFRKGDVVYLQPLQDLPEHRCIEFTALELLAKGSLKALT